MHDVIGEALMRMLLSEELTKKTGSHMMPRFVLSSFLSLSGILSSFIQPHFVSLPFVPTPFFCESQNLNFYVSHKYLL